MKRAKEGEPFPEDRGHPKMGCGADNCCQNCKEEEEKEGRKLPAPLIVAGVLLFLLLLTSAFRFIILPR